MIMDTDIRTFAELIAGLLPGESVKFSLDDNANLKLDVCLDSCVEQFKVSHTSTDFLDRLDVDNSVVVAVRDALRKVRVESFEKTEFYHARAMSLEKARSEVFNPVSLPQLTTG